MTEPIDHVGSVDIHIDEDVHSVDRDRVLAALLSTAISQLINENKVPNRVEFIEEYPQFDRDEMMPAHFRIYGIPLRMSCHESINFSKRIK